MMLKDNAKIPDIHSEIYTYLFCLCGGEVGVCKELHQLWKHNGIKFKCPKCDNWIVN